MELIETNETMAFELLLNKRRKISAQTKWGIFKVLWINDNNGTSVLITSNSSKFMAYNDDLTFLIHVPNGSKTIY